MTALVGTATSSVTSIIGGRSMIAIFICGAFVFGVSGGLAGVLKKLDFFGVIVLAGVVGLAGGAVRDSFLGIPAVAIFDWRVVVAVGAAGLVLSLIHI